MWTFRLSCVELPASRARKVRNVRHAQKPEGEERAEETCTTNNQGLWESLLELWKTKMILNNTVRRLQTQANTLLHAIVNRGTNLHHFSSCSLFQNVFVNKKIRNSRHFDMFRSQLHRYWTKTGPEAKTRIFASRAMAFKLVIYKLVLSIRTY